MKISLFRQRDQVYLIDFQGGLARVSQSFAVWLEHTRLAEECLELLNDVSAVHDVSQ